MCISKQTFFCILLFNFLAQEPTAAELSLEAGRAYVTLPHQLYVICIVIVHINTLILRRCAHRFSQIIQTQEKEE